MSRTPIREALLKLEQEGLVSQKRVVQPTESELRDIFRVRMLLEGDAARLAANYMNESALTALKESIDISQKGDYKETMASNKHFHDVIVEASNNKFMIDTINRMQSIIYLFRRTVVYHNRPRLIDEHNEIYQAILNRQPDEAEQLMKEHLQADLDFFLHILKIRDWKKVFITFMYLSD